MITPIVEEIIQLCQSIGKKSTFKTKYDASYLQNVVDVMLDCPEIPKDIELEIDDVETKNELDEICLTSGGADSTIAWYHADKPQGLYVDIGQPYAKKELKALNDCGIPYTYVDLHDVGTHIKTWQHIIPGRNLLFLTIAAELLDDCGDIHFSIISGEGYDSNKGDKSELFVDEFRYWYEQASRKRIGVTTYHGRTKGEWLKWFIAEGYDPDIIRYKTVTCFSESDKPCGKCQACLRKYLSFLYNNIDIAVDYEVHPMIGGKEHVAKYRKNLGDALRTKDFSHYSEQRCREDLTSLDKAELTLTRKVC